LLVKNPKLPDRNTNDAKKTAFNSLTWKLLDSKNDFQTQIIKTDLPFTNMVLYIYKCTGFVRSLKTQSIRLSLSDAIKGKVKNDANVRNSDNQGKSYLLNNGKFNEFRASKQYVPTVLTEVRRLKDVINWHSKSIWHPENQSISLNCPNSTTVL